MSPKYSAVVRVIVTPLALLAVGAVLRVNVTVGDFNPSGTGISGTKTSSLTVGDPIAASSGAYHFSLPLFDLGGPLPLRFAVGYRMDEYTSNGLLRRLHTDLIPMFERMTHATTGQPLAEITLFNGDALQFTWDSSASRWTLDAAAPVRYVLKETGSSLSQGYFYLLHPIREVVYIFRKGVGLCAGNYCQSRLAYLVDRRGNRLAFSYTGTSLRPDRVEDGLGRWLAFTYQTTNGQPIKDVTDQAGRVVTFTRELNAADCNNSEVIRSITDAAGNTTTFHYGGATCAIVGVDRPRGNTPFTQTIANVMLNGRAAQRVTTQTNAYGQTTRFVYDSAVNRVKEVRPDRSVVTYEHFHNDGPPRRLVDAQGGVITFVQTVNQQVGQVTDRVGNQIVLSYQPDTGKVASFQDASGQTMTATYVPQVHTFINPANAEQVAFTLYDQTRLVYPDGTWDELQRGADGGITGYIDRRGQCWSYTENAQGLLLTATNPAGGVSTFTYNADGTLASSSDSDGGIGTTSYGYDAAKRPITATFPGGATRQTTYDANDHVLTMTDELGRVTTLIYDANGNLAAVRDPLKQTTTWTYDLLDRVSSQTDPAGGTVTYTYDTIGRVASVTDANGNATTFTRDGRSFLTAVTDPAGFVASIGYNGEGVPVSVTTPMGRTSTFEADGRGLLVRATDPFGARVAWPRDAAGRVTSLTDRLNRVTTYAYDGADRLTRVTTAVAGSAVYTRDLAGRLTAITDPRGKIWTFGYSGVGRLTSSTDPLGNQRTYRYDSLGRLSQTDHPGSGSSIYTYDVAGQLTQVTHPGGPVLNYTYDATGRLLTAQNLVLTYDARGDVTNCQDGGASFGATYDNGRRLRTVSYDGQTTVTYTYDSRDLLTRVEDSRSGAWVTFAYDRDRDLVGIVRSNGLTTTFTRDQDGRVTRLVDAAGAGPAIGDQRLTLDSEGSVTHLARLLPLDASPPNQSATLTYDDASRIASAGHTYDARGRQTAAPGKAFVFDGADRLTQVTAGAESVSLTYNGLHDLRTRTAGGTTTTYYHHYALGLSPIVAETVGGAYKRFYVYTPDGSLLYAIEAAGGVRFYHGDHLGTTRFLTDGGGSVTDAFAYDPYGRLLQRTGTSDQPFTYVGQYGVRREPVGELYEMRARVYDPTLARFLTRDPKWPALLTPQDANPYHYGYQNPLRYIDPDGADAVVPEPRTASEPLGHQTCPTSSGTVFTPPMRSVATRDRGIRCVERLEPPAAFRQSGAHAYLRRYERLIQADRTGSGTRTSAGGAQTASTDWTTIGMPPPAQTSSSIGDLTRHINEVWFESERWRLLKPFRQDNTGHMFLPRRTSEGDVICPDGTILGKLPGSPIDWRRYCGGVSAAPAVAHGSLGVRHDDGHINPAAAFAVYTPRIRLTR